MKSNNGFAHRLNEDGTIDSICLNCFNTVAKADTAPLLTKRENRHKCANNHPAKSSGKSRRRNRLKVVKLPKSA